MDFYSSSFYIYVAMPLVAAAEELISLIYINNGVEDIIEVTYSTN